MATKNKPTVLPKMLLAECIRELEAINGQVYSLKQGVSQLIEAVKSGDIRHCQIVIDTFDLETVLKNLSPES